MADRCNHEYPPGDWTAAELARTLEGTSRSYPVPRYADEETWTDLATDPATRPVADAVVERAEAVRENPRPLYPISEYAYFQTEGKRGRQDQYRGWDELFTDVSVLALAECFEREGRFLDALLDDLWALCEKEVWLHPQNVPDEQKTEGIPRPVPPTERAVALRTARTAYMLGEFDYVFGDALHPALRDEIRTEVDHRVFQPYEAREDFWWFADPPTNNWNAVCNAGVALGALYLCSNDDRTARIVAKAVGSLRDYLNGFDEDGCTAEGVGYWNFGFGNYVQLASALAVRTDGRYSLLSPPIVREIAKYPLKVELSPGRSPAFSDTTEERGVDAYLGCWLGDRLDVPALTARGRRGYERTRDRFFAAGFHANRFPEVLRNMLWYRASTPVADDAVVPNERDFMARHQWWLARADPADPDGLVVAAKGGHNDESHNHNDCGTFVVHYRRRSPLTDLGGPNYDEHYFTDRRYEYLAARSLGHPVPLVDGCEQTSGPDRSARVVDRRASDDVERLILELEDCYPAAAGLESLRRTIALDRTVEPGLVTVRDDATFTEGESAVSFESLLVSYDPMKLDDQTLRVGGDRARLTVTPDESQVTVDVERLPDAIDKSNDPAFEDDYPDVWRARFSPPTDGEATVSLSIDPPSDD